MIFTYIQYTYLYSSLHANSFFAFSIVKLCDTLLSNMLKMYDTPLDIKNVINVRNVTLCTGIQMHETCNHLNEDSRNSRSSV